MPKKELEERFIIHIVLSSSNDLHTSILLSAETRDIIIKKIEKAAFIDFIEIPMKSTQNVCRFSRNHITEYAIEKVKIN